MSNLRMASVLVMSLVAALLGACEGGIGRSRAIELAFRSAPGAMEVVEAEDGALFEFVPDEQLPGEPRGRHVWAVVLAGTFVGECVAGASQCPSTDRILVVLDYETGALVLTEAPPPQ